MHVLNNTQLNIWGTFPLDLKFLFSAHFFPPLQTLGIFTPLDCHLYQLKAAQGYHWALPKFPFFTPQPGNCRNKPRHAEDSFLFAFSFSGITVLNKLMSDVFWVIVSYIFVWCLVVLQPYLCYFIHNKSRNPVNILFSIMMFINDCCINQLFHWSLVIFLKSSFFFFN